MYGQCRATSNAIECKEGIQICTLVEPMARNKLLRCGRGRAGDESDYKTRKNYQKRRASNLRNAWDRGGGSGFTEVAERKHARKSEEESG